jgi:hypothetical protein
MFSSRSRIGIWGTLIVGFLALDCGGGGGASGGTGGNGGSSGGSYSWSVNQTNSNGDLVSCVNYTNQKLDAAQAMTMVMGGTVSADPCPTAANMIGVCSGVDSGGNDYQQVFYNYSGLAGAAQTAGVQDLMLSCTATSGTWIATYSGMFSSGSGGGGGTSGGGAGGGGSGGSSGSTGACAQLLACCNAASSTYKAACMGAYDAAAPTQTSCQAVYTGLMAAYCPSL